MYRGGHRKVKFNERDCKSKRSFAIHGKKEVTPPKTKTLDKPTVSSPPLSSIPSLVQCSSTSIYDDLPDEKENKGEHKKGYLGRRLTPLYEGPVKRGERRISLTLPKEKKGSLLSSSSRERRHSNSERRQSITSQTGGKGAGGSSDTGGLSCTSSQASYGDEFIDNLTKLKLNLQLKNVTDRMFDVLSEYDKHNEENPNHTKFDKAGDKIGELDDMELKGNILALITDYKDACVEREKILDSLSNWFSKEHMQNFMQVINERQLSTELFARRSQILERLSSSEDHRKNVIDYLKLEASNVPSSTSSEQHKEPAADSVQEEEDEDSWKKSTNALEEEVSEPELPEHAKLQMEEMASVKEDTKMAKSFVEGKWTKSSEKLCELLRWARSEGFVDLVTLNDFLETMTDLTELFKSLKSELEQQKQVGVMSEVTIIKLTEENERLSKDVSKFEIQMSEARKTIRKITKQLKALQIASCSKHFTRNQMVQVEIEDEEGKTSNQVIRNLIEKNESTVKDLSGKLAELQMENTDLKASYEELKDQHETATEMFEKEIEDYKEEVKKIIAAIIPDVGSTESLFGSGSQMSLVGIRSSLLQIVDSRVRYINSSFSKRPLHSQLSEAPLLSPTQSGIKEEHSTSPQEEITIPLMDESTELREEEGADEHGDTGGIFSKRPPSVPRPSLAGDIVPSVKLERDFSMSADGVKSPRGEASSGTQLASMPTGASMPKKAVKKGSSQVVFKDSSQDSAMPEDISEYVVPGHALLPQSRPDVAPHGKQQPPSSLFNRRFTLPASSISVSSRSPSVMSGQSQNPESDHASNMVSSTSNVPSEAPKSGKVTADEWMNKEVKYKKRLSTAMANNAKTKMELLEKEKELRFAEHEIGNLKKQIREMEHLVAENEVKWRSSARGEVIVSEGAERFSPSSTSPASAESTFKAKRGLVLHRKMKPDSATRPKKVILKPGMVMTSNNIDNIVWPNSDEENMKLVKDLLKQMRLESCRFVSDTKARSRTLCDLKNVCNVVAHVKEKIQARTARDEESNSDHLVQKSEVDDLYAEQEINCSQDQREQDKASPVRNFTEHSVSKKSEVDDIHAEQKINSSQDQREQGNATLVKNFTEHSISKKSEVDDIDAKQELKDSQDQDNASLVRNFTEHSASKVTHKQEGGSCSTKESGDPDSTSRPLSAEQQGDEEKLTGSSATAKESNTLDFNTRMKKILKQHRNSYPERLLNNFNIDSVTKRGKGNARKFNHRKNWTQDESSESASSKPSTAGKSEKLGAPRNVGITRASSSKSIVGRKLLGRPSKLQVCSSQNYLDKRPIGKSLSTTCFRDAAAEAYRPKKAAKFQNFDPRKSSGSRKVFKFQQKDWIRDESTGETGNEAEVGRYKANVQVDATETTGNKGELMEPFQTHNSSSQELDSVESAANSGNKAPFDSGTQEREPSIASSGKEAEMRRFKARAQELDPGSGNEVETRCLKARSQELDSVRSSGNEVEARQYKAHSQELDSSVASSGKKAEMRRFRARSQEVDSSVVSGGNKAETRCFKAHSQELDSSVASSGNKAEMRRFKVHDSSTQELDPNSLVQSVLALVNSSEDDPGSASDPTFLSNIQDKLENIYVSLSKLPKKKRTSVKNEEVFHLDKAKPRRPSMTINALTVPPLGLPESRSQSSEGSSKERLKSPRRNTFPEGVEIILSNPSKTTVNTERPEIDDDKLPPVTPPPSRQRRRRQSMPDNIFLASEYRDRIAELKRYVKNIIEYPTHLNPLSPPVERGPPFRGSPIYHRAESFSGDDSISDSLTVASLPPEEIIMGTGYRDRRRSLQLHYQQAPSAVSNLSAGIRNSNPPLPNKFPLSLEIFKLYTKPRPITQEKQLAQPTVEKMKPFKRGSIEERISVSGNYISPPVEALHFASRTGMYRAASKEVGPQ